MISTNEPDLALLDWVFLHFMGWLSLKAGHLITRLCALILKSTKEDNVVFDIHQSPKGDVKSKPYAANKPRVKVQRLIFQEAQEFRERMDLPNSYIVIGNTIKGGRK
jgi:hypothetical protein